MHARTKRLPRSLTCSFFIGMSTSEHTLSRASRDGVLLSRKSASRMACSCLVVRLRRLIPPSSQLLMSRSWVVGLPVVEKVEEGTEASTLHEQLLLLCFPGNPSKE